MLFIALAITFALFIGISYVYGQSIFGILVGMVLISIISEMPFYRYTRNNN